MEPNPTHNDQLRLWWLRSREGDNHAFYEIHSELFGGLYNYAHKLLQDKDLANDTVQELFVKVWMKKEQIGEIDKVKPYFFTLLRRQILNQLRNLRLHYLKISMMARPDIDFSPEEIVVKNEETRSLQNKITELLNELPKRQKEVIYLHYFEDLDYTQIAAIMGINYQSVLNLTQKAMQKLRSANLLGLLFSFITLYRQYSQGSRL
jgi:RNA polymerase sigma factor (sigma-70 family)